MRRILWACALLAATAGVVGGFVVAWRWSTTAFVLAWLVVPAIVLATGAWAWRWAHRPRPRRTARAVAIAVGVALADGLVALLAPRQYPGVFAAVFIAAGILFAGPVLALLTGPGPGPARSHPPVGPLVTSALVAGFFLLFMAGIPAGIFPYSVVGGVVASAAMAGYLWFAGRREYRRMSAYQGPGVVRLWWERDRFAWIFGGAVVVGAGLFLVSPSAGETACTLTVGVLVAALAPSALADVVVKARRRSAQPTEVSRSL
jgi:hypothetical protein